MRAGKAQIEWINKMQYIHTTEYYTAIKKNKILIYATTQPWKYYAKRKKPGTKGHIQWFHLNEISRLGKFYFLIYILFYFFICILLICILFLHL